MAESTPQQRRTILVTGFGPFGIHNVNASWQAVEKLYEQSSDELKKRYNIDLIIEEIPVRYDFVSTRIPELWNEHKPLFVIHVGVSSLANCLTIENTAHSCGYTRKDVCEQYPEEANCNYNNDSDCCVALTTDIDVTKLCEELNNSGICNACVSNNAGRYLCEYTFYQSLCIRKNRTLFIHVPDSQIYSSHLTAQGLYFIICHLLEKCHHK